MTYSKMDIVLSRRLLMMCTAIELEQAPARTAACFSAFCILFSVFPSINSAHGRPAAGQASLQGHLAQARHHIFR